MALPRSSRCMRYRCMSRAARSTCSALSRFITLCSACARRPAHSAWPSALRIRSWRTSISACASPRDGAVAIERVALELSRVRLIVADLDAGNLAQGREQRERKSRVLVPQDADRPGPRHALPSLGETVHRDDDRRLARCKPGLHPALDRAMIGLVITRDAGGDLALVESDIAGHDQPVRNLHDQRRIVEAAVRVDQEPGKL